VLPLTSKRLQVVVREPYVAHGRRPSLLREVVAERGRVVVWSKMDRVRVYLDGPYRMLRVRLGDEVVFEASKQPLSVVGLSKDRSRK
jgi:NAD+ kinase